MQESIRWKVKSSTCSSFLESFTLHCKMIQFLNTNAVSIIQLQSTAATSQTFSDQDLAIVSA